MFVCIIIQHGDCTMMRTDSAGWFISLLKSTTNENKFTRNCRVAKSLVKQRAGQWLKKAVLKLKYKQECLSVEGPSPIESQALTI